MIDLEPLPRGSGFEFVDKIFGGSIPQNYRPAVEKGVREAAEKGWRAGCPVVDFRVTLIDGKYHSVDSSEMAFKIAGSLAFQEAMQQAQPTILEPVMTRRDHRARGVRWATSWATCRRAGASRRGWRPRARRR